MSRSKSRSFSKSGRDNKEENSMKLTYYQAQISATNGILTTVKGWVSTLIREQGNLNSYIEDWVTQKAIYDSNENLSEVVITNVFEGVCADTIKTELADCITIMEQTCSDASTLSADLTLQIAKLNEYIAQLNSQLTSLNYQMSLL